MAHKRQEWKIRQIGVLALLLVMAGCAHKANDAAAANSKATAQLQAKIALDIANRERAAGENAQAINYYRNALALDPSVLLEASVGLGDTLLATGQPTEAAEAYREAVAQSPDYAPALNGLGVALVALGQPAAAIDPLRRGMVQSPEARAYRAYAIAEDQLGHFKTAIAQCRIGLKHFPAEQGLREDLGLSEALDGQFIRAIATMREAAASPQAGVRDQLNLALVLGLDGRDHEAAQVAATQLNPAEVQNNLQFYAHLRSLPATQRAALLLPAYHADAVH